MILSAGLFPFSFITLSKVKGEIINNLQNQSKIYTTIFSKAIVNSLMMNGGDLEATSVDAKELMLVFAPLKEYGLIASEVVFLSRNSAKHGTAIKKFFIEDSRYKTTLSQNQLSNEEIKELLYYDGSFRETGTDYKTFEFVKSAGISDKKPICIVRFLIDKEIALKDAERLKKYLFGWSLAIVSISVLLAFLLGGFISRPVIALTEKTERLKKGEYSVRADINTKDEIGDLAITFNNMAAIIEEKIAELEKANLELKELDRLKDEFLANTSHELKTPVHGILGLTESLLDGTFGELNDKTKHVLSMIARSSRRLASLVNDILDFSRLKSNDVELNIRDIDVGTLTDAAITILQPFAKEKKIDIINDINPGEVFIKADEGRLEQILINLIGNAIKFTDKGFVRIESSISDGKVVVSIIDTGIGIPQDKQVKIFQSFFQADGGDARTHGGIGLGLAITKHLVDLHGGSIWFESKEGEGTTFYFSMPVGEKTAADYELKSLLKGFYGAETTSVINITPLSVTGSKILVVDDEPINLQILLNQLTKNNYIVKVLTNGKEALEELTKTRDFDLVLLDVMMPEMSGFEVCKKIREYFSPHELPVVLLTAKNTKEDIITGLSLGANDYITKPFDREELLARVKNYIALKKAAEEQRKFLIVKQELEIAKNIQLTILPDKIPLITGLSISAKYEPMMDIGGDFYDFIVINENKIGILIADVTGHGVSAALIASMIKVALHMSYKSADNPAEMLEQINSSLHRHIYGRFITALYIFIDTDKRQLTFSNAAHWPFYIHNRESNKITEHTVKGRLIGLNPDEKFKNNSVKLTKNDRIILFTDGIIEERNLKGDPLGEDKFIEIIKSAANKKASRLLDDVFLELYNWSLTANKESLEDDATLIVIDIND